MTAMICVGYYLDILEVVGCTCLDVSVEAVRGGSETIMYLITAALLGEVY